MDLGFLVPTSMAYLGSICLGLALVLVLIDMPGGANWSKVAGWLAVVGGFGTVGGAGGMVGSWITTGADTATSWGEQYLAQLIGGGAVVVLLLLGMAWAYSRLGQSGKGAAGGGKGKTKKVRSMLACGMFAIVGAAIAALVPSLYDITNDLVGTGGGALQSALASL